MKVSIIMGSTSDLNVMQAAMTTLEEFGIEYEKRVISAHRTPQFFSEYISKAEERGIGVVIAGAGGAAHLPGMAAAMTHLPVIGVPIQTQALGGMDSLLSIVQMPSGVPVATMAINGAKNAALYAVQIASLTEADVKEKLIEFRKKQAEKVLNATI
ncbi:MAG: 5-(carboxyamino)imidazole ribonucleotide mutase [Alistipes sp.]|nr:5-(carboxyamino)imidazole ribonucleotide mutase [Candidatus Alistipes equi]